MKLYNKGTKLFFLNGKPAYEKIDNDECGMWVSLFSNYLVEKVQCKPSEGHDMFPESNLPLWGVDKQGKPKLNRTAFKWPDEDVREHYSKFMTFQ